MKKDLVNTKNVCTTIGILFGSLLPLSNVFVVPCAILLILGGIQMFEMTKARKKLFETHISLKLEEYQKVLEDVKKENLKLKHDIDSLKLKLNVGTFYSRPNQ